MAAVLWVFSYCEVDIYLSEGGADVLKEWCYCQFATFY